MKFHYSFTGLVGGRYKILYRFCRILFAYKNILMLSYLDDNQHWNRLNLMAMVRRLRRTEVKKSCFSNIFYLYVINNQ